MEKDLIGFTLGGALGVATAEFVIVGAIAWLLRRFWKSAFGPPMTPAGVLAGIKIMAVAAQPIAMVDYALVSIVVGFLWWIILSIRDTRAKGRDPIPP